jgi:hypothetical protein
MVRILTTIPRDPATTVRVAADTTIHGSGDGDDAGDDDDDDVTEDRCRQ